MHQELETFLRLKQVKALVGLGRTSIYERVRSGEFPRPVSIGPRAVAWTSSSIAAWQARQIEQSRVAPATEPRRSRT
jgi:prophage regulatory protein